MHSPARVLTPFALASLLALLAVAAPGCAAPVDAAAPAAPEETSQSAEAFSGYWSWSYGLAGTGVTDYPMGPAGSKTCFLSGVTGTLGWGGEATAMIKNGNWVLRMNAAGGILQASAVCIPTVKNYWRLPWASYATGEKILAAVRPDTRCGIDSVVSTAGGFQSAGDSIRVRKDSTYWYVGGTGNAAGEASCVDVTPGTGIWGWEWIAPNAGSHTISLLNVPDVGTSPLGTQCFLMGLGGNFTDNGDWSDGATVQHGAGGWTMTVKNGKTGWATCVQ